MLSYLIGISGFLYALYKYIRLHGIGKTIFAKLISKLGRLDKELLKSRAASLAKKMATIIHMDLFDGNLQTVTALESYLDGIIVEQRKSQLDVRLVKDA